MKYGIAIVWGAAPGNVEVSGSAKVTVEGQRACIQTAGDSLVAVSSATGRFCFDPRHVDRRQPIWMPAQQVAVTIAEDDRDYQAITRDILALGLTGDWQRIEDQEEDSFAAAAAATRKLICDAWLGLSRDMRLFTLTSGVRYNYLVQMRNHGIPVSQPSLPNKTLELGLVYGRGAAAVSQRTRWLDGQVLPILCDQIDDGPVRYTMTCFAALERSSLSASSLRGTDYLVADGHGRGHMHSPEQRIAYEARLDEETTGRDEQIVLYVRVRAVNRDRSPRYAFMRAPGLSQDAGASRYLTHDPATGMGHLVSDKMVVAVSRLNGQPMASEAAVLLKPGEAIEQFMAIPHSPMASDRAAALAHFDFDRRLEECRAFWRAKLDSAAQISVPEQPIASMIQACLLHLDLITFGREPDAPVAPSVGVYCPIGSESSPIIQFFDSMGWHKLAERSIDYFLEKQRDDGMIQNFGDYMLETGPALWTMSEHFRYTRDTTWVKRIRPRVLKACDFLLAWRQRNLREDLRGKGYGLIEGRVADPEDQFRQFMLNGYACQGVARSAEILEAVDDARAAELADAAAAWREDVRIAFRQAMERSPVMPLGDGTWSPTAPPWAEGRGFNAQMYDAGSCFTHGTFATRDSLIGPLYLILSEVLDAREPMAEALLRTHQRLFTVRNGAFSQPYYTRHDFAHLCRDEVKQYLSTYYTQAAGLADRETFTFWEHYYGVSPHKTHEEGWFLMQTRWMLWHERGNDLHLLPMIPRAWLARGKGIELRNAASYFGHIDLKVTVTDIGITARVQLDPSRKPTRVVLRLPHPDRLPPRQCDGGTYDAKSETVTFVPAQATTQITLRF